MTSSFVVPVIDVQNGNFKELWPAMVVAIKTSSFVAVDTELSGLGNRTSLLAQSIEDRYKAICHAARSRSILSLGIACYKKFSNKAADTYLVQVYNLTLLCSEEYIIEPQSVQFLVQHGFDFNKQYAKGIPYHRGNNKACCGTKHLTRYCKTAVLDTLKPPQKTVIVRKTSLNGRARALGKDLFAGCSDNQGVNIRALFTELLRARKPLVLHNGLIDIAFLYQNFYAHLPDRLVTFTADLSEMFPAGIFDTKYVTEFDLRFSASYLEYAYKKCKLDNSRNEASGGTGRHVYLEFCQYAGAMSRYVDHRICPAGPPISEQADICRSFSAFGWCSNGTKCPLSHDTDLIILHDDKSKDDKKKKRKRQKKKKEGEVEEDSSNVEGAPQNKMPHLELNPDEDHQGLSAGCLQSANLIDSNTNTQLHDGENMKTESEEKELCEDNVESTNTEMSGKSDNKADPGTHRAGFDAFMTGYIFAYSCTLVKKDEVDVSGEEQMWLPTSFNKVYLSGKATPLNIVKSTFSKSSKAHVQKMEMIWGGKQERLDN